MMMKASTSRFCTHFLLIFNTFAGLFYFGGDNLVAIVQTLRGVNVTSRPFALGVLLPFDAEQSPIYELVALFLYLHSMIILYTAQFIDSFILTMVFHASGQIEIICYQLETLIKQILYKSSVYATQMLIQKHNKVILFSQNVDKLYNFVCLVQVFGDTIVICALGLVIMISDTIVPMDLLKTFSAYSGVTIQIFIYCYIGEHLSLKSKSIADAGYNSLWYDMSVSQTRSILFIIMRSQKPLTLTAGGITDLSLEAFTSIMKTAASYMSVLNAMY